MLLKYVAGKFFALTKITYQEAERQNLSLHNLVYLVIYYLYIERGSLRRIIEILG